MSFRASLLFVCFLASRVSFGQGVYQTVYSSDAMESVIGFVANREKFKSYGCSMETDHQELTGSGSSDVSVDSSIFEDAKKRLRRCDVKQVGFYNREKEDFSTESLTYSSFHLKGNSKFFEDGNENLRIKTMANKKSFFVPDPWMVPITETSLMMDGEAGGSNYWLEVLDESRLLWAESNGAYLRGEWRFGDGEGQCFVQVYFDTMSPGGMPILVRYIRPKNQNERFVRVGRTFVSESEITWKKFKEGYVPAEVRNRREDFWASRAGSKRTQYTTIKFKWNSQLCDDEDVVDPRVFAPGILTFDEVKTSFTSQTRKSKK